MTRIFGMEHPGTIRAILNLAVTYQNFGKYTEAEKLETQGHELKRSSWSRISSYNYHHGHCLKSPGDSSSWCRQKSSCWRKLASNTGCFESSISSSSSKYNNEYWKKKGIHFGNCCLKPLWCFHPQSSLFPNLQREFQKLNTT